MLLFVLPVLVVLVSAPLVADRVAPAVAAGRLSVVLVSAHHPCWCSEVEFAFASSVEERVFEKDVEEVLFEVVLVELVVLVLEEVWLAFVLHVALVGQGGVVDELAWLGVRLVGRNGGVTSSKRQHR